MRSTDSNAMYGGNLLRGSLPIDREVVYTGLINNKNDRAGVHAVACLADAERMIARIDKGDAK